MSNNPTATTIAEYLQAVAEFQPWKANTAFWFRGESKAGRTLAPSLLRPPFTNGTRGQENDLRVLFQEHAPAYLKTPPQSWIDWNVLMQHHGCPTRLLDWTESAFVALYFVVRRLGRGGDDVPGVVYVLDPNKLSTIVGLEDTAGGGIVTSQRLRNEEMTNWLARGAFEYPLPILPTYNTPRALAQKSRFTIYPYVPKIVGSPVLRQITIPADAKEKLFWQLKTAGITASTLFPDLDGLARELRSTVSGGADSGW